MKTDKTALIRALNDLLRRCGVGGVITITRGVSDRGQIFVVQSLRIIADANDFGEDNDPYSEHDFGSVTVSGEQLFWKIDYYDKSLSAGAEDPGDPRTCTRVMTVMLAREY